MGKQIAINELMEKLLEEIQVFSHGDQYKSDEEILEAALTLLRDDWKGWSKEFGASLHQAAESKERFTPEDVMREFRQRHGLDT